MCDILTNVRKSFKLIKCAPLVEKSFEWIDGLRYKLQYGRDHTARRVLTDYIGDRLADIKHIPKFKAYINGDVVTIDGGEWLKGAGQFSLLDSLSEEDWAAIRKR